MTTWHWCQKLRVNTEITADGGSNPQVTGRGSQVAGRSSQVTGCSVRRYNKKHFSHIQPFSSNKKVLFKFCTTSESLMVVVFYL